MRVTNHLLTGMILQVMVDPIESPGNHLILSGCLVGGGTNPFEKYPRPIGSFPQVNIKPNLKPPPRCWGKFAVFFVMFLQSGCIDQNRGGKQTPPLRISPFP